jgi:hypothetical protein
VEDHDLQLRANNQFYAAYSHECDEYQAALAEYNR